MFFLVAQVDSSASDGHLLQLRSVSMSWLIFYVILCSVKFSCGKGFFRSFQMFNYSVHYYHCYHH